MIPIGLGIAWAGYTLGVWGYCLVRGYNVTFMQLFKATWPGGPGSPLLADAGTGVAPGTAALGKTISPAINAQQ